MFFASDNAGPAHPKVMAALNAANSGYSGSYGADAEMAAVTARIRDVFEVPEAAVYLVGTGSAANALLLGTMTNPWETVFCTPMAHINVDECNAPEFYTGAKLTPVPAAHAKMTPDALANTIAREETRGVHGQQRGPVSLTQVTEMGTVYSVAEITALTAVARDMGCQTHMDGARFSNALVAIGCTPAEMTWKAGIDTLSFGGTKNGLLGVEACVIFDQAKAWEFELRRKRGGHLFSKHRFLSAQMLAYLTDDLWLATARKANANCATLTQTLKAHPDIALLETPQANMIFAKLPRDLHQKLQDSGAVYMTYEKGDQLGTDETHIVARFVTDWSLTSEDLTRFATLVNA